MPVDYRAPNINARRLGLYLRMTREKVLEISYAEAAERLGRDTEWLIRVETGFAAPSPAEVADMLERYEVRGSRAADVMIDLAARPTGPDWLAPHLDRLDASDRDILILESEARVVRTNRLLLVPELLRTRPYARLIHSAVKRDADPDADWDLLAHRQRNPAAGHARTIDAALDESLLVRMVRAPETAEMTGQLRHLIDIGRTPTVSVRVVPQGAPVFEDRLNAFDIFEFPEVNDRVTVAHHALGADVSPHDATSAWDRIDAMAHSAHDSRELIRQYLDRATAT